MNINNRLKGKKVFVTGGAGFIGSHLVERLLDYGANVTIYDDFSTGKFENIPIAEDIEIIQSSVLDRKELMNAIDGTDIVFHFAALLGVQRTYDYPFKTIDVSISGTKNVLDACIKKGISRIMYASSSAVYGDQIDNPVPNKLTPATGYAVAKLLGEKYLEAAKIEYGIIYTCLRYFNVYGPRQNFSKYGFVIPIFINRVLNGKPPIIYGNGKQIRDFTYIDDAINCTILSVERGKNKILDIGTGHKTTILKLAYDIVRLGGLNLEPEYHPPRPNDIRMRIANIENTIKVLHYSPKVNLTEGLKNTFEYYKVGL